MFSFSALLGTKVNFISVNQSTHHLFRPCCDYFGNEFICVEQHEIGLCSLIFVGLSNLGISVKEVQFRAKIFSLWKRTLIFLPTTDQHFLTRALLVTSLPTTDQHFLKNATLKPSCPRAFKSLIFLRALSTSTTVIGWDNNFYYFLFTAGSFLMMLYLH